MNKLSYENKTNNKINDINMLLFIDIKLCYHIYYK